VARNLDDRWTARLDGCRRDPSTVGMTSPDSRGDGRVVGRGTGSAVNDDVAKPSARTAIVDREPVIRRTFLKGSAGLGLAMIAGAACASTPPSATTGIADATALTEVFGDGMKLTAVAVHYDRDVDTTKLALSSFTVADRTVTRVYANTVPAVDDKGRNGRYVIVKLSADDAAASLWASPSRSAAPCPPARVKPGAAANTWAPGTSPTAFRTSEIGSCNNTPERQSSDHSSTPAGVGMTAPRRENDERARGAVGFVMTPSEQRARSS
jgi:hypothetical protein